MYPVTRDFDVIRATVADHEAHLARLDGKIAQLIKARAQEAEAIATHLAFYAPIRRLPVEIIRRIFVETTNNNKFYAVDGANCAPLNLTKICRAWRLLAINIPSLWD